ncbi:MAG: hypothetical protein IT371_10935 [Deltaproteobacteria bacterium]|nr:hypothetical protein [Deltaproteobacteria bacterium]
MSPRDPTARCRTTYAKWIDRLLLDEPLAPRRMARLREHLSGCELCQARYNRVVQAERLLAGGARAITEPSVAEVARVRERLLGRARLTPEEKPRRLWLFGAVGALAAAGLAAIVLWPRLRPTELASRPSAGEFQTRGSSAGSGVPSATAQAKHNLRAFCVGGDGGHALRELVSDGAAPPSCALGAVLRLAYTNRSRLGHLFVVGLDERYALKWYAPAPPETQSLAVRPDAVDEPLARAVRLGVNHRAGLVRLFALFSARPLSARAVEQATERARHTRTPLAELRALPLPDTEQRSLLVRLVP